MTFPRPPIMRLLLLLLATALLPACSEAPRGTPPRVGEPLQLKFVSTDNRSVDVPALKGKVVLVDFWATWCGPCVKEVPRIKALYEKHHAGGLEIVGINCDEEGQAFNSFLQERALEWPQFFDGKGWKNQYVAQYGIDRLPTMWLIDKSGNVRDLNPLQDLEHRVETLLAE